jgi:hypothetical protein
MQESQMVKSMMLSAALFLAVVGSAYAADQPEAYSTPGFGPKASGGENMKSTHFQKPPGYDQNPANFPYTRPGVLKAN